MTIVAWPVEDDFISIEPPDGHEAGREDYERARANAAMARLKVAVERIERELRRQRFTLAAMPAYMVREIQEWAEAALTPKAST